jgi:uncharacterized protein with NRDE domain
MCLAVIALQAPRLHKRYALVIAANRDEFHARAAQPAHWWDRGILAGRDLVGGGTWFGVTRAGRWALITNFREGAQRDANAPSRGALVTQALRSSETALVCAARIGADGARYHGYNLLLGEAAASDGAPARCAYVSNRASGARGLGECVYGLSNHLLDTPWPKLVRIKAQLAAALARPDDIFESAFALLADRQPADVSGLPSTGISPGWEHLLSSAFIVSPTYGTRCSTVVAIGFDGTGRFVERSFGAGGDITGEVAHEFRIDPGTR